MVTSARPPPPGPPSARGAPPGRPGLPGALPLLLVAAGPRGGFFPGAPGVLPRDRESTRLYSRYSHISCFALFFNDTATTEIYTLPLHDALPIWLTIP